MSRKKPTARAEFVFFNVLYDDGTLTSNRKIPLEIVSGLDADIAIRGVIEAQDAEIAERSGRNRGPIKDITRVKR